MKKVLQICEEPKIRAYAHHAFVQAIIQNSDHVNNLLYSVRIGDYKTQTWEKKAWDLNLTETDGLIDMTSEPYTQRNEAYIMRDCKEDDELEVQVLRWTYTHGESAFTVILTGSDYVTCHKAEKNVLTITAVLNGGIYLRENDRFEKISERNASQISAYKIAKKGKNLSFYITLKDGQIEKVKDYRLSDETVAQKIGITVNAGENQYYNWLFMNYLQTYYTEEESKPVYYDYYDFPERNYSHHVVNHFLEYKNERVEEVIETYGSFVEFCRHSLSYNRYIMVNLNEKYVVNRKAYGVKDFIHVNLIYGVDDDEDRVYVMGYNENLVLENGYISREMLETSVHRTQSMFARTMEYRTNNKLFEFDIEVFKNQLNGYLLSYNTQNVWGNMLPGEKGFYGIVAYVRILRRELGNKRLFYDHRFSSVVYERLMLMKERLEFLFVRGFLTKEQYEGLKEKSDKLGLLGNKLKMYALKNEKNPSESSQEMLLGYMEKIFIQEYDMLLELKQCL